ncbi:hypothetical protein ACHHYP_13839 [Achlya hypogyna]|uniref:Uncharacterized protein n=1 Tax=Achlya hypogyna TaxID=1202772 RepID=A0A1V9YEM1_ACHHY|nr:hypothetical protein ACHHYP_13839 [Achlya hypogyna]
MAEAVGFSRLVVPLDESIKVVGDLLHYLSHRFGLAAGLDASLDGFALLPSDKIALVLRSDDVVTVAWSAPPVLKKARSSKKTMKLKPIDKKSDRCESEADEVPNRAKTTKTKAGVELQHGSALPVTTAKDELPSKKRPAAVAFPAPDASAMKPQRSFTSKGHVRFGAKASPPQAQLPAAPRGRVAPELAKYGPSCPQVATERRSRRPPPASSLPTAPKEPKKEQWKRPYQVIASLHEPSPPTTSDDEALAVYPAAEVAWVRVGDVVAFKILRLCVTTMSPELSDWRVGRCSDAGPGSYAFQPCRQRAPFDALEEAEAIHVEAGEIQELRGLAGAAHALGQLQGRVLPAAEGLDAPALDKKGTGNATAEEGSSEVTNDGNDDAATTNEAAASAGDTTDLMEQLRQKKEQLLRQLQVSSAPE